jgi:hypothetical protein
MNKNLKYFKAEKNNICLKKCNLPIPRPPQRTPKLQEKPSAPKREHPALQNMTFLHFFLFCGSFVLPWITSGGSGRLKQIVYVLVKKVSIWVSRRKFRPQAGFRDPYS